MTDREEAEMFKHMYLIMRRRYETLCQSLRQFSDEAQFDFIDADRAAEDIFIETEKMFEQTEKVAF